MENIKTLPLLISFVAIITIVYFLAWYCRDEYSIKKPFLLYCVFGGAWCVASLFFRVQFFLALGLFFFGFIVMIFRNQHYFDKE
ncbi:preprotein translocase subunit YajC [Streptococcus gallinaceus]|uniref:hypothetical protein n=1 Tax=Streptococcus gallinaceus TaxID=165758 RepID=UPI00209F5981|nr:hypothetical protein [Streptococcus gallinaceus]MCP1638868.1 preprotein translocase subunit YajC [Streptococcus gallinaceus]MCP1769888.1 preprotein translocase subunit YajC [Streptococcus gallinaceus]